MLPYFDLRKQINDVCMYVFRETLSEKVHATIPKGIVGGFEFTVLHRTLKEWHERPWTYVCECERKATKVGSTATVSGTAYCSYPILPFGIVASTFFPTTFLEIAVYHFSKIQLVVYYHRAAF